jgi:hypothetical protein
LKLDLLEPLVRDLVLGVENVWIGTMRRCVLIRRRNYTCKCNLMRPIGGIRLEFVGVLYSFWRGFAIVSYFVRVAEEYQSR